MIIISDIRRSINYPENYIIYGKSSNRLCSVIFLELFIILNILIYEKKKKLRKIKFTKFTKHQHFTISFRIIVLLLSILLLFFYFL